MFFQQIVQPDLSIFTYVVGDLQTHQCVVIDPPRNIEEIVKVVNKNNLEIKYILETHVHADFVSGSIELKHHYKDKPKICCSALGGAEWSAKYADILIEDGHELKLGTLRLKAMHTPGHTPEHIIWMSYDDHLFKNVPKLIFTGDFLFAGSVGRPDLLGEHAFMPLAKELYNSLFTRLAVLPDSVEVFPAHGAGSLCSLQSIETKSTSTLGYERRHNPALVQLPIDKWIAVLQTDMPRAPASFQRIKKINVQGPNLLETLNTPKKLTIDALKELSGKAVLIDVRDPVSFAEDHLQNAINIPLGPSFANWAGMVLPGHTRIVLLVPHALLADKLTRLFWLVGYENIVGFALSEELLDSNIKRKTMPMIEVGTLASQIDKTYIIDVRTPAEWHQGHIENAHHMELAQFAEMFQQVPKEEQIAVICGSGMRASIAASILLSVGYKNVSNVKGGMKAWNKEGFPTTI
jgi:hydroxyacylglutathione hydrolase